MRRTKAERRHNDWTKIHHKAAIIKYVWQDEEWFESTFEGKEHRLNKSKVHCSCPMCSAKTRRNGYKISDLRKLDSLKSSLEEEEELEILPN